MSRVPLPEHYTPGQIRWLAMSLRECKAVLLVSSPGLAKRLSRAYPGLRCEAVE